MDRPLVVAVLVVTLLASGCATGPVTFVPPGVDRNELLEAIAKNGQGGGGGVVEPVVPNKPDPLTRVLVGGVEVTGKIAITCAVLALLVGIAYCHGNTGDGSGIGKGLYHLWTDD